MLSVLRQSKSAFLLLVFASVSAGCADKACFTWTQAEGACPSRAEAAQFFCADTIGSVDSEAEAQEGLCCYEVTKISDETFCFPFIEERPPEPEPFTSSGTGFGACDGIGNCNSGNPSCVGCAINGGCNFQFTNCQSLPECFQFADCASACPAQDACCVTNCHTQFPMGADFFQQLVDCIFCQECSSSCDSQSATVPPTCSGGSSSSDSTGSFLSSSGTMCDMSGAGGAGGMSGAGGAGGMGGTP